MKGVVFKGHRQVELKDFPDPTPGPGVISPVAKVGARVMVHHYHGCTACEQCRTGWAQLCTEVPIEQYGINAHGAHAEYLRVPAATLVPLDELSFTAGAEISCGTGTARGARPRSGFRRRGLSQ